MELIAQGAEAKIYREDDKIIKDRIKKKYRLAEIDEKLRKSRTKAEHKLLIKAAKAGVSVPRILKQDKYSLKFEYIDGVKVRDQLTPRICEQIGTSLAKLHNANIIHGDLTTSNMILSDKKVYFIDFGLGLVSLRIEDKAVDLHLFKECLISKHQDIWEKCWKAFLKGYKLKENIERLEIVESRGKYKKR